jgi:hypothetical protein
VARTAKKRNNKKNKPEIIYRALPKRVAKKPVKPHKAPKKKPKKILRRPKLTVRQRKIKERTLTHALTAVIFVLVSLMIFFVLNSLIDANRIYDYLRDNPPTTEVPGSKEAKIIGTDKKLETEITNFQSAPTDLQAYILKTYRDFKKDCIVNDQPRKDVSYKLESTVYDAYAKASRNCGGQETVLLKKFENGWAEVFIGNTLPPCSLVNDLTLPKGLINKCIDDKTIYLNPNP